VVNLEWPGAPELVVRTIARAIEELLLAGGRERVRVNIERLARGASYRCSWTE